MQSTPIYSMNLPRSTDPASPAHLGSPTVDGWGASQSGAAHPIASEEEVPGRAYDAPDAGGTAAKSRPPMDPYLLLRRALRGRYGWVILLALLGSLLGGFVGWKVGGPAFRSEGLVRIIYARGAVDTDTDQNKPMALYEAFMRTQEVVLGSRRIVASALAHPSWQVTKRGQSPRTMEAFAGELKVVRPAGTEHLRVTFEDDDPAVAAAGVQAVIAAYANDFNSEAAKFDKQRVKLLDDRRQGLQAELEQMEAAMRLITQEHATINLEPLYLAAVERVAMLESKMLDVRLALAVAEAAANVPQGQSQTADPGKAPASAAPPAPPTVQQIERMDPTMREYVSTQVRITDEIEGAKVRGLAESHPQIVRLNADLARATERIRTYAEEFRQTQLIAARYPAGGVATARGAALPQRLDVLQADQALLAKLLEQARNDRTQLSVKQMELAPYRTKAEKVRAELDEKTRRRDALQTESEMGGRLEVISAGEAPTKPFYDSRKKFVPAGALAGAAFPSVLLLLFGALNRRYRYSDEAATDVAADAPLLGILPALPKRFADLNEASAAAQCVHQMRVLLQVGDHQNSKGVYLVTSAAAGEGKTSMAVALALSFAAAGSRTLLIDCDVVGQRVTRGFRAEASAGLRDALVTGTLRGFLTKVYPGLYVLPVGTRDVLDAASVSPMGMRRLLLDARRYFDTVIIDSGPILGSVEAAAVAPEADGVIFAISRGQQPPLVERALRYLVAVRANVVGFVFNRAAAKDFSQSGHESSLRSLSAEVPSMRAFGSEDRAWTAFGPLVQAVALLLPSEVGGRQPDRPGGAGDPPRLQAVS